MSKQPVYDDNTIKNNYTMPTNKPTYISKSKPSKDKYNDINTGVELKEITKGLTGLNVGSNKLISNIVSKKALDD